MKWKKLFALALAGVMALALLTGCSSSGKSEARLIEENLGSYFKDTDPGIKVSYDIPELERTIMPDFSPEDWYDESGQIRPEKYAFLQESLKKYEQNGMALVDFYAFDATGYDVYMQSLIFSFPGSYKRVYGPKRFPTDVEWTEINIAVCHKTINGKKYCIAVIVESYRPTQTVIQ